MGTPGLNARVVGAHNPDPQSSSSPKKQMTLFVTITVAPENIEKFKEAHRPVWKACSEEPECLFFDVFQDQEVPGRFRFVEVWSKGREWFEKVRFERQGVTGGGRADEGQEQLTKPYYKILWEKSKPLWVDEAKMEYFEREGEGSVWSDEYLAGGRKMEKTQVVS
ncbi:uncharacterized protein PAC_07730 [Phialocephala subalpina]|uniref:ABM domain-containing protein n=1 Tax=Phialocephala subalpina TaxID=576137 RepID=A0A1L7WYK4_9HELO|nr:uncharacterized protein PAC_07730 [Phialocephala subalpina]